LRRSRSGSCSCPDRGAGFRPDSAQTARYLTLFEPRTATHPGTPAKDVVLSWKTFQDAANQAGLSRRYGGIHFESGDRHGRAAGASVGWAVYDKAKSYWDGTASG
jgi:hypothetical protein